MIIWQGKSGQAEAPIMQRLLAQSTHYYIVHEYETVVLIGATGNAIIIGDFYGDPDAAHIDWQERWCIVVGEGLILYHAIKTRKYAQEMCIIDRPHIVGRYGNYTKERDQLFGHLTVDDIVTAIRQATPVTPHGNVTHPLIDLLQHTPFCNFAFHTLTNWASCATQLCARNSNEQQSAT